MTAMPGSRQVWTAQQVAALGLTCDITTAAAVLGIGRTLAFQLLRDGRFPVRVLRLGRAARVPVGDLLTLLGAARTEPDPPHAGTSGSQAPPRFASADNTPAPTGAPRVRDGRDRPQEEQGVLPARGSQEDASPG